jgi:hypothetical protein
MLSVNLLVDVILDLLIFFHTWKIDLKKHKEFQVLYVQKLHMILFWGFKIIRCTSIPSFKEAPSHPIFTVIHDNGPRNPAM